MNNSAPKLEGRIAVITGASRAAGIGAAVCKELASLGADIFFTHWAHYDEQMPWGSKNKEQEQLCEDIRAINTCQQCLLFGKR